MAVGGSGSRLLLTSTPLSFLRTSSLSLSSSSVSNESYSSSRAVVVEWELRRESADGFGCRFDDRLGLRGKLVLAVVTRCEGGSFDC